MLEIAKLADEAGFDSVWNGAFFNYHGGCGDMYKACQDCHRYCMRNPVLNAAAAMDLDELLIGRMLLGLGSRTRSMNEMWYGEPFEHHSAAKMNECFALIRKIWAAHKGGWIRFEGDFYRLHIPAYSRPYSVRDRIPLYLAGFQKGMLRTTGEVPDGLVGHPLYRRKYLAEFVQPQLEIGAIRDCRTHEDIDVTTLLITAISHNREQAIQEAKKQIAFYASVKSYQGILILHGWEQQKLAIWYHFKTVNLPKMAAPVTDDMVEQIAIAGTPDECREPIDKWKDVVDLPILYTPTAGVKADRMRENHRLTVETFEE